MFKNKGNFNMAMNELKNNSATSFIIENKNDNDGLLKDVVVTLKDLFATTFAPTQSSSKILEGFHPHYNASIINKLEEAGASIVAKVHMDELALGGTGQYNSFGKILNPLDSERLIGGSSSGSASTFTKSIGLAIGSDTGDSVRLPASYIGKFGFKPSYGAISRYGLFPYSSSLDTIAYFAHNVNDIIIASQVMYGVDEKDMTSKDVKINNVNILKPKKIGVIVNKGLLDYQSKAYDDFIKLAKKDNIEILEFEINQKLLDLIEFVYQVISYSEVSSNDSNLTGISFGKRVDGVDWDDIMHNTRSEKLGEMVQRRFTLGAFFLQRENQEKIFIKAKKVRRLIVDEFNKIKKQVDVLAFPATTIAPKINDGKIENWTSSYLINSNLSGCPSISMPFSKHEGMPFNLSIDGLIYEDEKLLSHALYIEKLLGGKNE